MRRPSRAAGLRRVRAGPHVRLRSLRRSRIHTHKPRRPARSQRRLGPVGVHACPFCELASHHDLVVHARLHALRYGRSRIPFHEPAAPRRECGAALPLSGKGHGRTGQSALRCHRFCRASAECRARSMDRQPQGCAQHRLRTAGLVVVHRIFAHAEFVAPCPCPALPSSRPYVQGHAHFPAGPASRSGLLAPCSTGRRRGRQTKAGAVGAREASSVCCVPGLRRHHSGHSADGPRVTHDRRNALGDSFCQRPSRRAYSTRRSASFPSTSRPTTRTRHTVFR